MTGIFTSDEAVRVFTELKLGRSLRWIIFKLSDVKPVQVIVESTGAADEQHTWDHFVSLLPANECRYAAFSLDFDHPEGRRNKMIFLLWSPSGSSIKNKMVFAASKADVMKAFTGIGFSIGAHSASDLSLDSILDTLRQRVK